MCGFIFGTILLLCGLWAVVTGKLPAVLFGKAYNIAGLGARLIGAILMVPLPLSILAGAILILTFGEQEGADYINLAAVLILVITLMSAWVVSRFVRQPVTNPPA